MRTTRNLALGLTIAAIGLSPAAAVAGNGSDDGAAKAGDDNGAVRTGDDKGGRREARRTTGRCTARSSAKLKAKDRDGRLETEFEVDQNRNGVTWKVRLRRNGELVVRTRATTKAPSGSFSIERRLANPAGTDRIAARATSPSGEVCKASLTI